MSTTNSKAAVVKSGQGKKMNILGHSATVKLSKEETQGDYYVCEIITPPGYGIPPHVHDREDEMIYVAEGEFAIKLGDEQFIAKPGDQIFFPRYLPHAFQNIGSTAGKTLWTIVPGGSFEEFFDQLGALPPGQPDMEKVTKIFKNYGMKVLISQEA